MIKRRRMLALILVAVMALSLMACGGSTGASTSAGAGGTTETAAVAEDGETPLVVGYSPLTAYDQDVQALTQLPLLTSDRMGAIIYKGIEGETIPYNGTDYTYYGPADLEVTENADGTVFYDFTLRDDLRMESPSRSTTLSSLCMYSAIPLMTDPLHFSPSLSRVWKSTAPVWRHSLT